jgi:hypothetical protein
MDPIQIVIVFVSVTLTTIIAILSIQVWNILKELRVSVQRMNTILEESGFSVKKVNKMLDDAGKVSETVSEGVVQASGFVQGIKTGLSVLTSFAGRFSKPAKEGEKGA